MYQKKEYIFSETLGVCRVDDITKLSQNKGEGILYYVLRPINDKDKVAYIPVENHAVMLRNLISPIEAAQKKEHGYEQAGPLLKQEIDYVLKSVEKEEKK